MKIINSLLFIIAFICSSINFVESMWLHNNCTYTHCNKISFCDDIVVYSIYKHIILIIDKTDMIIGYKIEIPKGECVGTKVGLKRPLSINADMSPEEIKREIKDISYRVKKPYKGL